MAKWRKLDDENGEKIDGEKVRYFRHNGENGEKLMAKMAISSRHMANGNNPPIINKLILYCHLFVKIAFLCVRLVKDQKTDY